MYLQFSTTLPLLLAGLTALASATPILDTRQSTPTSTVTPPSKFYLQSKVVNGKHKDRGTNKDKLNVFSYHTGAGLGAATADSDIPNFFAYVNGTEILYDYKSSLGTWPLRVDYGPYQSFSGLTISVSSADTVTQGYYFNETGLQFDGGQGWLLCDWWYTDPQLFVINEGYNVTIPSMCSKVDLIPIAYPSS